MLIDIFYQMKYSGVHFPINNAFMSKSNQLAYDVTIEIQHSYQNPDSLNELKRAWEKRQH